MPMKKMFLFYSAFLYFLILIPVTGSKLSAQTDADFEKARQLADVGRVNEAIIEYKKIISVILNSQAGRDGFIPWHSSGSACSGADSVLSKAKEHFDKGNISQALTAAQAVLEKLVPALGYADDSSGNMGDCIESSLEILH